MTTTITVKSKPADHQQLVMLANYRDRLIANGLRDEVRATYEHIFGMNAAAAMTDAKLTRLSAALLLDTFKRYCKEVGA